MHVATPYPTYSIINISKTSLSVLHNIFCLVFVIIAKSTLPCTVFQSSCPVPYSGVCNGPIICDFLFSTTKFLIPLYTSVSALILSLLRNFLLFIFLITSTVEKIWNVSFSTESLRQWIYVFEIFIPLLPLLYRTLQQILLSFFCPVLYFYSLSLMTIATCCPCNITYRLFILLFFSVELCTVYSWCYFFVFLVSGYACCWARSM